MFARRLAYSRVALVLTLATIGCSKSKDDLPREPVAGTVTMDDQPLPEAVILFSPAGDAAEAKTSATAEIKDGKFSVPREDGLVPGTYNVSISHAKMEKVKTKAKGALSKPTRLGKEEIPARYNAKTTLSADIPKGGKSDLNFPLTSK